MYQQIASAQTREATYLVFDMQRCEEHSSYVLQQDLGQDAVLAAVLAPLGQLRALATLHLSVHDDWTWLKHNPIRCSTQLLRSEQNTFSLILVLC